ncbi:MAG: glycosyltransferase [Thiohalomonadaceae bacterium]
MSASSQYLPSPNVDVIIPVYRGYALTRNCIESVLASVGLVPFELVVVDDCSPEPELSAWLQQEAALGRFTLLTNDDNLGFVRSVNCGMALHPDRDVVLLNSDTEVADGWLDRLCRCVDSAPDIGTATPFSNNATICSYPVFAHGSELPAGWSVAALDDLFRRCNAGEVVDIPTAVGFCMYIRRACLDATGLFDEQAFGKGYGEENDFCMRAAALGWRHVLCADCFVAHIGAVSFAEERYQLQDAGRRILLQRYPDYEQQVAKFIAADPLHHLRKSVDMARLADGSRIVVLAVSHDRGGGVEKHLRDFAASHAEQIELLTLEPRADGWVSVFWNRPNEGFVWGFRQEHAASMLPWLVESCQVQRLYIHHLLGYEASTLQALQGLGLPYDMMLHDYFYLCPQIHLQRAEHTYCGEPDETGCNACLKQRPVTDVTSIAAWREHYSKLLEDAERVFAPSVDALQRYHRYFPSCKLQLLPHDETYAKAMPVVAPLLAQDEPLHVVVLGALGYAKGFEALRQVALRAQEQGLPLRFTLLGYGDALLPQYPLTSLLVTGRYRDESLAAWLERLQPHLLWFPAQVPETYSYTLSAALRAGLPVAVTDLGALPERVAGREWSWVLAWDSSPQDWLDYLLTMRSKHFLPALSPPRIPAVDSTEVVTGDYAAALPAKATRHKPLVTGRQVYRLLHAYPLLEISIVTWNSASWLDDFFTSLCQGSYPLEQIRLLVRDNGSSDDTVKRLRDWLARLTGRLAGSELECGDNIGFGAGHNANLSHATGELFLISNVDLELEPEALLRAVETAMADDLDVACWEFRQKPFEHPKHYDPISLETTWASAACLLLRTAALRAVGGFEPRIFLYGEDVELSYRLRDHGYRLRYLPRAACWHHAYERPEQVKPLQFLGAVYAGVALRMRYADKSEIRAGWLSLLKLLFDKAVPVSRRELCSVAWRLLRDARYYGATRATGGANFPFNGFDYEIARAGGFHACPAVGLATPKVSLIMRTAGCTAEIVREMLLSVRNQTYPNLELVIIDDGQTQVRRLCNELVAAELTVLCRSLPGVSRAHAGNAALELASGEFVGFLDGDGLLYADHIETLAGELVRQPDCDAVYASCMKVFTDNAVATAKQGWAENREIVHNMPFSFSRLWIWNHIPIHTVMFRRSLYLQQGGFAEELTAYEDWHLWVRYSMKNTFCSIDKTTAIQRHGSWSPVEPDGARGVVEAMIHQLARQHRPQDFQVMLDELALARAGQ